MKSIFFKRGITLIEVLIVVAILVVLATVAVIRLSDLKKTQVLSNAVYEIVSTLNTAKNQTMASYDSSSYGVHFQSDRVIIFKGTVFSALSDTNQTVNITSPAVISNISLTGGSSDVYFQRLTGAPSTTGTITVTSSDLSKVITISASGVVSVN